MKLPLIRSLVEYAESNDKGTAPIEASIEVLEQISQARGLKDEEIDVIGELISNMCGALEVHQEVSNGTPQREALNQFMQRVLGSIEKQH